MNVTSLSSISYCNKSDYWPYNPITSGNIHSITLYVYVGLKSAQSFPFIPLKLKQDKFNFIEYFQDVKFKYNSMFLSRFYYQRSFNLHVQNIH